MQTRNCWHLFISVFSIIFWLSATTASCETFFAPTPPQNEAQALENLRQLAKNGVLPPESVVAGIEARYPNTKTAALARLLRAVILLQNNDALNASGLLDTNLIAQKTSLGDYALWLRGQALVKAAKSSEAAVVFEKLISDYPDSLRVREARLTLANIRWQNGETERALGVLQNLLDKKDAAAWLLAAQINEKAGRTIEAIAAYRQIYYFAPIAPEAIEAENSLKRLGFNFNAATNEENVARANAFYDAQKFNEAAAAFQFVAAASPAALTPQLQLRRGAALANAKRTTEAIAAFNSIPSSVGETKAAADAELAKAYASARQWTLARQSIDDLRRNFSSSALVPKTLIALGMMARDAKNKAEESFYLQTALTSYPNAIAVGQAQFELAWLQHEAKNFQASSQQLIEHLARYAAKDTTFRGRAGYWAARDSQRAGKTIEACALYNAVLNRYEANWYGYLSKQRLDALNTLNQCPATSNFASDSSISKAIENLKTVTVAPETAKTREKEKISKADELGTVALFDWSLAELNEAARTAPNSPAVNLGLARLYRRRGDNVAAFLALARSYPDYSQMKPEELSREEWDIFYPLQFWDQITLWARNRNLDQYQVAGLIRQESVFNPQAKSGANAFGLMQLILPTARTMAKKYNSQSVNSIQDLYNPALNIELGTAYMREQLDKYGRIEYLAAAYNAGPGRVVQWQQTLPFEMDEFVEAIPFRETKSYVQGVVRNTAQYRRLYDTNGQFKPNVGTRPLRGEIDFRTPEQFAQEFPEITIQSFDTQSAE